MLANSFRNTLLHCIELLEENKADYWLDWGSLLQSRRGEEAFYYDFAFDIGIRDKDLQKMIPIFKANVPVYEDAVLAVFDDQNQPGFKFKHVEFVDVLPMKWILFYPYTEVEKGLTISFVKEGNAFIKHTDLFPLQVIKFENISIKAPRNADEICKQRFGAFYKTELFPVLRPKKRYQGESEWSARLGTNSFPS